MQVPVGNTYEPKQFALDAYSPFQRQRVTAIVTAADFDFASCTLEGVTDRGTPRPAGPTGFLWHTKDGVLHYERIGVDRVLYHTDV